MSIVQQIGSLDLVAAYVSAIATLVAMVFSVAFPIAYTLTADWWRNPIGRVWMISSVAVVLLVTKPTVQLAEHLAVFEASWYTASVNVVVAVALIFQFFTYLGVVRKARREEEWKA